jgi:hypothetical protein
MPNPFRTHVADLVDALEGADLVVIGQVPENATPPFVYFLEDDPWITPGSTFGSWRLSGQIVCVAEAGSNEYQVDQLADLVAAVLTTLPNTPFVATPDGVSTPAQVTQNDQACLGCTVNVRAHVTRAELNDYAAPAAP